MDQQTVDTTTDIKYEWLGCLIFSLV
jgi:hypothetical protein